MLKGIDVSSWQGDIQVQNMPVDFVITKATEGENYVNPYCDPVIQRCRESGKLWGFYHFGNNGVAQDEADFFIDNCLNYFGEGIPVLDWEDNQSAEWVNIFVKRVYERTGVIPWIYANPWRFNQGGVDPACGRWVASYPDVVAPSLGYDPGDVPDTDGLVVCHQYASDGQVPGYDGNLDVNHFFGDESAWRLYAKGGNKTTPSVTTTLENDKFVVSITEK